MKKMWLSIIIPVYNAKKYLPRCLESLLAAAENLYGSAGKAAGLVEILLVDNNSTDQSAETMQAYHAKYPKLFAAESCATPGAGAARNYGARLAKGEYLWFIDADDSVRGDALAKLHRETRTEPDIVMFGAQRIDRRGQPSNYLSAVTPDDPDYKSRFVRYGMGPWQVIVRRAWWQGHRFTFREDIIHEDMELMSALILDTEQFAAVDEPLYLYYDNPGSVLHKSEFNPHIFDVFPAMKGVHRRFLEKRAEQQYRDELEWFFIWNVLIDAAKDFRAFPEGRRGFGEARKLLRAYYPRWRRNRFLRQKPLKLRVRVRLNYWGI